MPLTWKYGKIDDVAQAAKDWPQLNFFIYHSDIRSDGEPSKEDIAEFEKSGHIPWISELAEIPEKNGVKNVYAEIGGTFANNVISAPRFCTGILGTLIKGMGIDHVIWGTDSVWHGSPQWQIEAFRYLEIPEDLRNKFGFAMLDPADGYVKSMILGKNAAKVYNVQV
jgi:uncharacterized protein